MIIFDNVSIADKQLPQPNDKNKVQTRKSRKKNKQKLFAGTMNN